MAHLLKGSSSCVVGQNTKDMMAQGVAEDAAVRLSLRAAREADPGKPHKDLNDKIMARKSKSVLSNLDQVGTET